MTRLKRNMLRSIIAALALFGAACASPQVQHVGDPIQPPVLKQDRLVTSDNAALPVKAWTAKKPDAILLGIHGMNDYSKTFAMAGPWFARHNVSLYAYDQRGFGEAPEPGIWPGTQALTRDAQEMIAALRTRHPDTPVYILGVSMGGAVAMTLCAESEPDVDGLILIAPAVWGWSTMNPVYKATLQLAAHIAPAKSFTGEGLDILPSDNIEMLRDNYNDPLMIINTRTDAIYGLVNLMESGYRSAPMQKIPTLVMYGDKDEIIPRAPVAEILARMPDAELRTYRDGYHMLLRDLQAEKVWADILTWVIEDENRRNNNKLPD